MKRVFKHLGRTYCIARNTVKTTAVSLLFCLVLLSPATHADPVTLGDGVKGLACVVTTFWGLIPGSVSVSTAVQVMLQTAIGAAVCPAEIHVDDFAHGCYPQLGMYYTCPWASGGSAEALRVQDWINDPRAANGMQFSESLGGLITDNDARMTCIFIVAQKGKEAPEASWNQGGCMKTSIDPEPGRNVLRYPPHEGPPRIMIVGDSISHGQTGDYTWRYRLHEHLRVSGEAFDFVGPFVGPWQPNEDGNSRAVGTYKIGGWDDDHDATWGRSLVFEKGTIENYVNIYQPDLIVVDLGTNDLTWFNDRNADANSNAERVVGYMREFITNARRAKPNIDVVMTAIGETAPLKAYGQPAPYNQKLEKLRKELDTNNSRISLSELALQFKWETDTYDQTHPNVRGEYVIAKSIANTLHDQYLYGDFFDKIPAETSAIPKPLHVAVAPGTINRSGDFTITWDRVTNPGVWTEYKVQLHYHQAFGFGLIWESPNSTPNLSMVYDGPTLPQIGTYHVVVVATDMNGRSSMSDPVSLQVDDLPALPPPVANLRLEPSVIGRDGGFIANWDRVTNPGIWTDYKVQLRYHQNFGFGLVWQSPGTTPNLSLTYDGQRLPQAGVYQVVVLARDWFGQESMSEPASLTVEEQTPPPLPPRNLLVSPLNMARNGVFSVSWDRVPNPKIWTEYKVQLRNHPAFGYGVIWESGTTPNLSLTYNGPMLTQAGVYAVVVVARDINGLENMSAPTYLTVQQDPAPPPPPTNISLAPSTITRSGTFTAEWDRVVNPGIWTTYKMQVRNNPNYGFGLLWESASTANLSLKYTGPTLPQNGIYNVGIVAQDTFGRTTMSEPLPLTVRDVPPPPPAPSNISLTPSTITRSGSFTALWNRVDNPGIWTDYKMQVRYHQSYGYGLVWQSSTWTPDLSLKYTGPTLPQAGVFQVVIVAHDIFGQQTMSAPVTLTVNP